MQKESYPTRLRVASAEAGRRLDQYLAAQLPEVSRARVQELIRQGKVEVEGEDVTDLLDGLGYLDRNDVDFNKVLFEIGGGMSASNGRVYVDISYRFRKFLQTGEPINVSGVYAGAGVGF